MKKQGTGVVPTSADPFWDRVAFASHFDGTNNGTTFIDEKSHTINNFGNVITSTTLSKFGGSSAFFGGGVGTDYLQTEASSDWTMNNMDFTIECWFNVSSNTTTAPRIISNWNGNPWTSNYWSLHTNHPSYTPNHFTFWAHNYNTSNYVLASTTEIQFDTWYHVAVTKSDTTVRLFINGVQESTFQLPSISTSLDGESANAARSLFIGGDEYIDRNFNGYIDDIRITKGIARYTSNFTIPSQAFPNSKEISDQDFFADGSTRAFYRFDGNTSDSMTGYDATGAPAYVEGQNFDRAAAIDGLWTRRITLPTGMNDLMTGTKEWAISMWLWTGNNNSLQGAFEVTQDYKRPGIMVYNNKIGYFASSNGTSWDIWIGDGSQSGLGSITINMQEWTHVVYMRDSVGLKGYVNGVLDHSLNTSASLYSDQVDNLLIGTWWQGQSSPQYRWTGRIDHVRLFDRGLTQQEVTQLANEPHY